jgi:hypothetical protein
MKYRDFTYKGIKFHLNDNKGNREFEGKYDVVWWDGTRWQSLFKANSKAEAKYTVRQFHKAKRGCYAL